MMFFAERSCEVEVGIALLAATFMIGEEGAV
jgi:hypothetical protein